MGRRIGVVVVVAAAALVAISAVSGAATRVPLVQTLRAIPSVESTRVVIECSEPLSYGFSQTATSPPAIAVDLRGARLSPKGLGALSLAEGPVRSVRGVRTATGVRLLIEARGEPQVFIFPLPDPFRLIIDVKNPRRVPARAPVVQSHKNGTRPPSRRPKRAAEAAPPGAVLSRRFKVVIDPGHGGKDPGATGVNGIEEKDVVLAISLRLAAKLRKTGEFDVVLTRDRDVYLPLEERTARANAEQADLFVSIHANASLDRSQSGLETYYLNNTEDRGTIRLAQMENGLAAATDHKARSGDVAWILSDMVQSYKVDESVELAHEVQQAAMSQLHQRFPDVRDLGVKRGPFYVLVGAGMPSVLVEVSFLTHAEEGRRLTRADYQDMIAVGLLRGLRRFAENSSRSSTL